MPAGVIGFVGLGNMGIPMTQRLVAAGYHVRGYDTSPSALANFAAIGAGDTRNSGGGGVTTVTDLTAVGDGAEAVILMLPDSDIVERVVLGQLASAVGEATAVSREGSLIRALPNGAAIIDMSSSDPARTRILAGLVATSGHTLIDAPVSGGVSGAKAGTLAIMVGGSTEDFERFQPMLSVIGKKVVHAGDIGSGHAVKALNNLMSAAHLLVSSEALIAGRRFGMDPAVMLEIVNGASGRSASTENKWPNYILTEKYDAGFSIRLMVKDVKLALGIEHATGVPSAASEAVVATWEAALADLPPDADHTAIARWLADRTKEQ
ncbi:MAG TPA: NAD(P)-dependent oxidoreductase [Trebonia sp.]|jgi:3-hydroxyisobutyrate dehydrogenase|nr:NAD(P)-dependent oxidoreductase [Trebonia sp.]